MNIGRVTVFKDFALSLAQLSKCEERQVAAVITDQDLSQVYSIGINGGPKGLWQCMCTTEGKYGCLHAEINALCKCTSVDPNKSMFITLSPCKQCAAAIINAGITRVYILEDWKDSTGLNLLKQADIDIIHV